MMISERGHEYGVKHLLASEEATLSEILSSQLCLNAEQIHELLRLGSIYCGGQRLNSEILIRPQDYLRVHTKPRRFPINHFNWFQRRVFENQNYLILNKPSGLPCHSSVDNTQENLLIYASDFFQKKLFMTHRLDVPTSGLLVLAKSSEAQSAFNKCLEQDLVEKKYEALVSGQVPDQESPFLIHHMEKSPKAPKILSSFEIPGKTQVCKTEILNQETVDNVANSPRTLFKLKLHTGRTHQLRSQLAFLGHPIIGDKLYGSESACQLNAKDLPMQSYEAIALTSVELAFIDPLSFEKINLQISRGFNL